MSPKSEPSNGSNGALMRAIMTVLLALITAAIVGLGAKAIANTERIRGVEVQSEAQGKQLDSIEGYVKEILREMRQNK